MQDIQKRPKIAAIIPAYNEEKTIGGVVAVLRKSSLLDEVIVISDASTDATVQRAREAGATLVYEHTEQGGKGEALMTGVEQTQASVLVFFDADLIGLTLDHVERLVLPIISGAKVMNVGMRDRGPFWTSLAHHLPLLSGERAMKRIIFDKIPHEYMQGFMVEQALNYYCRINKLYYGSVFLSGLHIRHKYEKVGWIKGLWQYAKMFYQVGKAILIVRFARLTGQFSS